MSSSSLKAWFQNFGTIVDVFIPKKRSKVRGLCFAFVRFRHEYEALNACEEADGSVLEGFDLEVNLSRYPRLPSNSNSETPMLYSGTYGGHLAGVKLDADLNPRCSVGRCYTGAEAKLHPVALMESKRSLSYAQVLSSGGGPIGVLQSDCFDGKYSGGVTDKKVIMSENPDHLQAVMLASSVVSGSCLPRADYFSGVNECFIAEMCVSRCNEVVRGTPHGADFIYQYGYGDPVVVDLCSRGEGVNRGIDLFASTIMSFDASYSSEVDGDESVASSVFDQLRNSLAMVLVSQEPNFLLSDGVTVEVAMDQGTEIIEEPPLIAAERAEISAEIRYIIHDALQIGKAMEIKFTPRDKRMIKRFVVLRHFDKVKWRMNFDDEVVQ